MALIDSTVWRNWDRLDAGPPDAGRTVLLIPGGLCSATFYEELMAEPALAGVHLVAVTLPGHGGTPPPSDFSIENYARMAGQCASDLRCDAVVGHSIGANVALEMAGSGAFRGPIVLLAPSFSRRDESMFIRALDRLSRLLGALPYGAMRKLMGGVFQGSPLPPERREVLTAELVKNDPPVMRAGIHSYLRYLDRHGEVASRLCAAGVRAWVVHGETGDGGVTDSERRILDSCADITVMTIPGASMFTASEEPALVAGLVIDALEQTT
jgi:pimeloyl-ACP methyl ester carboxylesterase